MEEEAVAGLDAMEEHKADVLVNFKCMTLTQLYLICVFLIMCKKGLMMPSIHDSVWFWMWGLYEEVC